ncbi:MAG: alpha/beta hydrolase [Sphingomicrobium sp.]
MADRFIRPDVRQFIDYLESLNRPKGYEIGPEAARQMMVASRQAFELPARNIAVVRDIAGPVPLRLYDAREKRKPGPMFLFIHGGGWVIGGLDTHEPFCIDVAIELDVPLVAVDYRLAPEHPFPAAVEDSIAVARWIASGPAELGRVATSLFMAGDSAGGNLAAVVSAALRDHPAAVPVAAQWLLYPACDPTVEYPSYDEFCEGHLLTKGSMDWFEDSYSGPKGDWRYSPLLAGAAGLPPTFVVTAALDPIRDQGRAYAARCAEAGVETVYLEAAGTVHGFLNLRKGIPSGQEDFRRCLTYLKPWVERVR